eukprot:5901116-Pleurochrysis_carterae.AAC.5
MGGCTFLSQKGVPRLDAEEKEIRGKSQETRGPSGGAGPRRVLPRATRERSAALPRDGGFHSERGSAPTLNPFFSMFLESARYLRKVGAQR